MKIYVKLYATLASSVSDHIRTQHPQKIRAGSRLELDLPEDSTLVDLVTHLALPKEQVKVTFVNAKARDLDYHLQPGDEVGIFPPVGGGQWNRLP
jgi:molybdopterin converting factor small subunit